MRWIVLLIALAACKQAEEAPTEKKSGLLPKLEAMAEQACACKDHACAQQAYKAMMALAGTAKPDEIPADDIEPLQAAQAKLEACVGKLNPRLTEYAALTDEVCACKNKKCAEKVSAKFSAWADDLRASKEAVPGGLDAIKDDGTRAAACLQKHGLAIPQ
jgi:hypothetical protein